MARITLKHINIALVVICLLLLAIVLFVRVDVLACPENRICDGDWYLHVDTEDSAGNKVEYATGDNLVVHSQYVKKRSSNGISRRYIECKNEFGRFSGRFPIGESNADRPTGAGDADLFLKVPQGIQCRLPGTCRVSVNIEYPINGLRDAVRGRHIEQAHSNEFTCKESETALIELPGPENDNTVLENAPTTQRPHANQRPPESPAAQSPPPPDNEETENGPIVPPCGVFLNLLVGQVCL